MQQSFEALGQPLCDTTFCVLDIETTGGAGDDAITEIGAVKLRGGECLGKFQTLVNPGVEIPASITVLTGITQNMVTPAPYANEIIGSFLDFVGDSVIVGHNVRFDLRFLNAALRDSGYEAFHNVVVDTCSLARRLVRDEVMNCKLHTLSRHFRLANQPSHRALDDALATGELLHILMERAGSLGILGLRELVALPTISSHPNMAKLTLTNKLPKTPGVYVFRNANNDVLYVGKAVNIRSRVRSYFTGDDRRKVGKLLHETARIDAEPTINEFAAGLREIRMIHKHEPHYNQQIKNWRKYAYLALTLDEKFPRLAMARTFTKETRMLIGPLSSRSQVETLIEGLLSVTRLRRCNKIPRGKKLVTPCLAAQLGVADCPCTGLVSQEAYGETVKHFIHTLANEPHVLMEGLIEKMNVLASKERFEEAAEMRNRADLLSRVLTRQQQLFSLRRTAQLTLLAPDQTFINLTHGRVDSVTDAEPMRPTHDCDEGCPSPILIHPRDVDELIYIARYIQKYRRGIKVLAASDGFEFPDDSLPRVVARPDPVKSTLTRRYADAVAS